MAQQNTRAGVVMNGTDSGDQLQNWDDDVTIIGAAGADEIYQMHRKAPYVDESRK